MPSKNSGRMGRNMWQPAVSKYLNITPEFESSYKWHFNMMDGPTRYNILWLYYLLNSSHILVSIVLMYTWMKPEPYLKPLTKTNLKWIEYLHVRLETEELLEKKKEKVPWHASWQRAFGCDSSSTGNKIKNKQAELHQRKELLPKKWLTQWKDDLWNGKKCLQSISDKKLTSKI